MPEGPKRQAKARKKPSPHKQTTTNETDGYLSGLFTDFNEQVSKYVEQVHHLLFIQARVDVTEKNLVNTREHFAAQIARCKDAVPHDWSATLARARFVGARLSEACMVLLKEHRRLSPKKLLDLLNDGQYRFKSPTPFREIHGAMIKQSWQRREGEDYIWNGPDPQLQLIQGIAAFGDATTGGKKAS